MSWAAIRTVALGTALAIALPACSPAETGEAVENGAQETNGTVAEALAGEDRFAAIAGVLTETGVASVFDGAGSYTVLAPTDTALESVLETMGDLPAEERRVVLIGLLRQHILPGQVTIESIRDAIEAGDGQVQMRTLGDGLVTFTVDGDTISVAGAGGRTATLGTDLVQATNGAVVPLDAPIATLPGS